MILCISVANILDRRVQFQVTEMSYIILWIKFRIFSIASIFSCSFKEWPYLYLLLVPSTVSNMRHKAQSWTDDRWQWNSLALNPNTVRACGKDVGMIYTWWYNKEDSDHLQLAIQMCMYDQMQMVTWHRHMREKIMT